MTTEPAIGQFSRNQETSAYYFIVATGLSVAFIAILAWFAKFRVYDQYFFATGPIVTHYQVARFLFSIGFGWLITAFGMLIASILVGYSAFLRIPAFERYPLCFLIGAGSLHVLWLILGLLGLDIKPMAIGLALGILAITVPYLADSLKEAVQSGRRLLGAPLRTKMTGAALGALLLSSFLGLAVVKGLYPAGGHDYFNHYFQFYKEVIDSGSIRPNLVWYHFFYSKGAGLYFWSMLLTDPLAPQLVTMAFSGVASLIVIATLRRCAPNSILPWLGAALYFAFLIYTPGPAENRAQGGWADFEKIHELNAVFILGVTWITYNLLRARPLGDRDPSSVKVWCLALCGCITSISILTTPLTLLPALLLGATIPISIRLRKQGGSYVVIAINKEILFCSLAGIASAILGVLTILAINYFYTGLLSDQLIRPLWRFANLNKLQAWGVLFEAMQLHQGTTGLSHNQLRIWTAIPTLASYLRLDLWWPLAATAILILLIKSTTPAGRKSISMRWDPAFAISFGLLFAMTLLTSVFGGGLSQSISFYRLTTFCYAPMLCFSLFLWSLCSGTNLWQNRFIRTFVPPLTIAVSLLVLRASYVSNFTDSANIILRTAAGLAEGRQSLKDSYQAQWKWPGRLPWGGIYPGIIVPWKLVGRGTPIWRFDPFSYCMLPHCNAQTAFSFRLSRDWDTIFFGAPAEARKALQQRGLNYFFFSKELGIEDYLPASRLFSPNTIGKYLGVKWTDGVSYLLTWASDDTKPLDANFLASYRNAVANDQRLIVFETVPWKGIAAYLNAHKDNLQPFRLPWCDNCQGMKSINFGKLQN